MSPPGADVFGLGAVASPDSFIPPDAQSSDPRVNIIASILAIVNAAHLTFGIFLIFGASARERVPGPWVAFAVLALATETLLLFSILGMLHSSGALASLFPLLALVAAALVTGIAIVLLKTRPFAADNSLPTRV